jgi:hypothetical protein
MNFHPLFINYCHKAECLVSNRVAATFLLPKIKIVAYFSKVRYSRDKISELHTLTAAIVTYISPTRTITTFVLFCGTKFSTAM